MLEVLHSLAPAAPVFTSMYDPDAMPPSYRSWDIHTTWINRLPGSTRSHQRFLPAYPAAFSHLRVPDCELLLSSSSAFAKMVRPPAGTVHICYTHSPMRFAWDLNGYVERERLSPATRLLLRPFMDVLRRYDRATLRRVHRFVANSTVVRDRIRAFWGRDATVIHPPVEVDAMVAVPESEVEDYFLMVSRLVPYKRFDLAIEACNQLRLPLRIVGSGRDREALEATAGPTIQFLGRVDDEELRRLYARCRATIFMSEDDFGIAQVEAQAAGRPVIALGAGGALDTVRDGETGILVREQTVESLVEALRRFETIRFSSENSIRHAATFSRARFERDLTTLIDETLTQVRSGERYWWN